MSAVETRETPQRTDGCDGGLNHIVRDASDEFALCGADVTTLPWCRGCGACQRCAVCDDLDGGAS